jgi:secondary thiamine-phosphate synthase enzyme
MTGFHANTLTVSTTERIESVDLTDRVRAAVAACGVRDDLVSVCSLHTTAAVLVTRSDGTLLPALQRALEGDPSPGGDWMSAETPGGAGPPDATAHLGMLMLGHSLTLQISAGESVLGEWQRVLLAWTGRARQLRLQLWGLG